MDRRHGEGTQGNVEAGPGEQAARHDRLGQGDRGGVTSGRAHDDVGVAPGAAGAAARLRHEGQREPALFERAPELVRPAALLRRLDQLLGGEIGEEPADSVGEEGPEVHRSPSPRAMMPRSTSRVPPRRENDGARCTR